jgi:1-deoxy-D-xylulose-5-phosphate reductoisomerase
MKIPIAYALSYPGRIEVEKRVVKPADFSNLTFDDVDTEKFSSIGLAKEALAEGGTMPAVLNAANETAVYAFLNKEIKFTEIMRIVELTMNKHQLQAVSSLDEVFDADAWARSYAKKLIKDTGD